MVERNNKPEHVDVEPSSPQTQLLREGAQIMKLESQEMFQLAIMRPRDPKKILAEAIAAFDICPEFAEKVEYNKPVGRAAKCPKCKADTYYKAKCPECNEDIPQTFAQGFSIRAAEALGNRWENSAFGVQPISETDTEVILGGTFMDYEKHIKRYYIKRVSKYRTTRDKKVIEIPPDRFADLTISSNQSKLVREMVKANLPPEITQAYLKAAKQYRSKGTLESRIEKMLATFKLLNIDGKQIEAFRNKAIKAFSGEDVDEMIGIFNAIRDEETTVEQVFGGKVEAKEDKANLQPKASKGPQKATTAKPDKSKKTETAPASAPAAEGKPKDWCPYCKAVIPPNKQTKNRSGEQECNECGYELVERPQ